MATILVTGGAGYIGSHACKRLAAEGHLPVTLDDLRTGWRDAVRFGPLEECDLGDAGRVAEILTRHRPAAILHFAALSDVGQSAREPALYWRNNVLGALNLIEAAAAASITRFVLSSTCAVYGEQDGVMLDETCPTRPINAYGGSKLAIERLLADIAAASGMRWAAFRYFNVAGADSGREIGEHHRPETHLIPLALDAARGRRDALTVNGTDWPTPDGTCVRDYVHVEDLIDAHLLGLSYLETLRDGTGATFNLGTGRGYSVREVVTAVGRVTGTTVPAVDGPRRGGDCASLVSGSARAAEVLGWRPERSLDEMIADAWAWHQRPGYGS